MLKLPYSVKLRLARDPFRRISGPALPGRGAQIPGVPAWMLAMKAKMLADGGSRDTAREIYTRMFEESNDDQVKDMARKHLLLLDSLDQSERNPK